MNEQFHLIPSASALFEEEIKKSVFITHLAHTPSVEAAKQFVEQVKKSIHQRDIIVRGFAAGRLKDSMKWGLVTMESHLVLRVFPIFGATVWFWCWWN
ncbi:hypothetical protein O9929_21580 [Vibrio lentus]|nr:hypothetical protein [Vibrio lentus]